MQLLCVRVGAVIWGGSGPRQEGGRTAYPGRVSETEARALAALDALGVAYAVTRHGRVGSLAEAAALRGVEPGDIVKTLVVRRAEDDYLFVLVPGDREFSWPKLRALLGTSRLSMPDAAGAYAVTGYERGTITPFGAQVAWPVVVDPIACMAWSPWPPCPGGGCRWAPGRRGSR